MCGRYFLFLSPERLQQLFGTETVADYNPSPSFTPLQFVPMIVRRRMGMARWGLLPEYAQEDDKTLCAKLKNARSETITEKPSFATLWQKGRRCLIPASGFVEWPEVKVKGHPGYAVTSPVSDCLAFAGIWSKRDDLVTCTILTQPATAGLDSIHSRMPVAFYPDQAAKWFETSPSEAERMMRQESITADWRAQEQEKIAAPLVNDLFAA